MRRTAGYGYDETWEKYQLTLAPEACVATGSSDTRWGRRLCADMDHGSRFVGGQLQSSITHKVTLRYRSGVTAGMRLLFENRAFNIRYVANLHEQNELLELLVEEGVST